MEEEAEREEEREEEEERHFVAGDNPRSIFLSPTHHSRNLPSRKHQTTLQWKPIGFDPVRSRSIRQRLNAIIPWICIDTS